MSVSKSIVSDDLPWNPERRSLDGTVPLEPKFSLRLRRVESSSLHLEELAPLELGAKLERKAHLSLKVTHVVGRVLLLVRDGGAFLSAAAAVCALAPRAAQPPCSPLTRTRAQGLIYIVAMELFPVSMHPGGSLWSLLLVWSAAYHLGEGFELIKLPKSLGMLIAGLVLQSLPSAPGLEYTLVRPPSP